MFVLGFVQLGRQQRRCTRSRFGIELLLRTRSLQTVDRSSVYDLVHRFRKTITFAYTNIGYTAVIGRGNVRTDHVIGAFAPRVFDHVCVSRHSSSSLGKTAIRRILLVLQSGFFVCSRFLPFATLFHADDNSDGNEYYQRDDGGDRNDEHDVLRRKVRIGGYSSARRGARRHLLALATQETGRTVALVTVDAIRASGTVLTGFELTFVDFFATVFSCETRCALTLVIID